ncbi:Hypothetical protein SRAE_1000200800 [Strongyloides ratti]|uniref:Uncharacterized protein n=1 Tax=Strongyloides ratti TaxID=34506 RepID=A0A090L8F8_STRRB|nr:Hypothetical protein SRAE_1000200800 [Strongyloides ratti]CEF63750.1 Hypothetical protein SRAE_1000200800 [Strongyloides ratti]
MFFFIKIIIFILFIVTFNVINCSPDDCCPSDRQKYRRRNGGHRGYRSGRNMRERKTTIEEEENKNVGKDIFKRPEILGMATPDDPKYATLKKLNVNNILGKKSEKKIQNDTVQKSSKFTAQPTQEE